MSVIVVAPTYQEAENILPFLEAVRAALPEATVLIVDDNSPDGTGTIAEQAASQLGNIEVLHRTGKLGLGSAYRAGFSCALDRGFDVIVSMDVDLSHDPRVLPDLVARLGTDVDAVIGSRYVPGGRTVAWPWHRRVLSRWGNRYTSLLLRLPLKDCTSGYRVYRAEAMRAIDPLSTRAEGYGMLTEFARRMTRSGLRVVEHPIVFTDRQRGTSKMSGRIITESMLLVTAWGVRDLFVDLRRRLLRR